MIPKSFSASSLQVAENCLARYKAEFIDYGRSPSASAANVGIVCHGTLEEFIRAVFMRRDAEWDMKVFLDIFNQQYTLIFGSNQSKPEYDDAKSLCLAWFKRGGLYDYLSSVKILSLESKSNFQVKTTAGELPVNYIMDRLERIGPDEYRVVDYKTNRVALNPSQLQNKIQARLYALAVQIVYKTAKSIWVEFDYLRSNPVAVEFKRDDNVQTFRELQRATQRIIDTDENKAPETLNAECGWCVRKSSCETLQKHINAGGIAGKDLNTLVEIYKRLTEQQAGQKQLIDEIEMVLLQEAISRDTLEYETTDASVMITTSARRSPNHAAIATILGSDLATELGTFRVGDIDKLIMSGRVPAPKVELLKAAMPKIPGDPKVKVEFKK